MSQRPPSRFDDDMDRWIDDPSAPNASRLAEDHPDGDRWRRWHRLLSADAVEPDDADAPGPAGRPTIAAPPLTPRDLPLAARAVAEAWRDPSRRARLRAEARAALADAGVAVPPDVEVVVVTAPDATSARGGPSAATLEVPLPAPTAPPVDEAGMRRALRETRHAWVLWAAFGPFEPATDRAAAAAPARARAPWRRPLPARTWAIVGALAAAAVALLVAPGVLGPLTATAAGPAQGVRLLLGLAIVAGAVVLWVAARRR